MLESLLALEDIRWGKITRISRIARGGMAELFLVLQESDFGIQRKWILKQIHCDLKNDPLSRDLFVEEAKLHATISHPHVVQLFDFGHSPSSLYMALEFVEGGDLNAFSFKLGKNAGHERIKLGLKAMYQIAHALNVVHKVAIHQDISPANVLCAGDGSFFKLCDFGVAKRLSCKKTPQRSFSQGKFRYMSPEQVSGSETDARSDIFSLGVTFAEFFSKSRPYGQLPNRELVDLMRKGRYLSYFKNLDLPSPCWDIVFRCIQPSPKDRFQSAAELAETLSLAMIELRNESNLPIKTSKPVCQTATGRRAKLWSKAISALLAVPFLLILSPILFLIEMRKNRHSKIPNRDRV